MSSSGVMISRELQVTLQLAMQEAVDRRHEYVCLEHLLYAMLHDVTASDILRNCGADLDALRAKLRKFLDEQLETVPKGKSLSAALRARRSARAAARRAPCAIGGTRGDQRRRRAGRDVPRDRVARDLLSRRSRA